MAAYESKSAFEQLSACAGSTKSLQRKAGEFIIAAEHSKVCTLHQDKAVNSIRNLMAQSEKIALAPHNETWFSDNLKKMTDDYQTLSSRAANDHLGNSRSLPISMRAPASIEIAKSNDRYKADAAKANQNLVTFSQAGTSQMDDYIRAKYGFESKLSLDEETKRAQKLHQLVMSGNRDNALANYLNFSQNFDFSDEPKITDASGAGAQAEKMFGKEAGYRIDGDVHVVSNLDDSTAEMYRLGDEGEKMLKTFSQRRKGAPPYTVDQVYNELKPYLEQLKKINTSYQNEIADLRKPNNNNNAGTSGTDLKDRADRAAAYHYGGKRTLAQLETISQKTEKTPFGFLFQTNAFKNSLNQFGSLSPAQMKAVLKRSLKEQVKNTMDYAQKFVAKNQGTMDFIGGEKGKWSYDHAVDLLMYSSPSVIQKALLTDPKLLGSLCAPMKLINETKDVIETPGYMKWGGAAMGVIPIVGTTASFMFATAVNGNAVADANNKIDENQERINNNQRGELVANVNLTNQNEENAEASKNIRVLKSERTQAIVRIPTNLAISVGIAKTISAVEEYAEFHPDILDVGQRASNIYVKDKVRNAMKEALVDRVKEETTEQAVDGAIH